jgi:uncharacterized RDD family membrane protein YckC
MTRTINRIPAIPAARVCAVLYFFLSFVFLPFMAIPLIMGGQQNFGIGVLLVMPFLYAIGGFLSVALMCWLYNIVAPRVGGIQFQIDSAET